MSNDPWKHRSAGMRCRTCIWFVAKEPATTTLRVPDFDYDFDVDEFEKMNAHRVENLLPPVTEYHQKRAEPAPLRVVGRCRRHAPTMNGYPVVFEDDWCGDHRLDENEAC